MTRLVEIVAMGFIVIAIYLFLSNGNKTVSIITALANGVNSSVKNFQGRD